MPAGDKTGPSGQGPFTGRRGGNPPPRLGRRLNQRSRPSLQKLSIKPKTGGKNARRR